MQALSQQESRDYIRAAQPHKPGTYNPTKYVICGWTECTERQVLDFLYLAAHEAAIFERQRIQNQRSVKLNTRGSGTPKVWQRNPRDVSVLIPAVRRISDAWFAFTNCKLDTRETPLAEQETFTQALRRVQPRKLP